MICPKCSSTNVNVQIVTETKLKQKKHGVLYWLFIGWWLKPILWLSFTIPMIIIKIFKPAKYKMKQKTYSMCICQNCGNNWKA